MVYTQAKYIFYTFLLFISILPISWAQKGVFAETSRLNKELAYLKKHSKTPFVFLHGEEITDSVSTQLSGVQKVEGKPNIDSIMDELEEEVGPFKPSPPHYAN